MTAAERLGRLLYRYRLVLSASILVGAAALAPRVNLTDINNDLSAWVAKDTPEYQTYERFTDEFGGTRNMIVAFRGPVFTPEGLQLVERLTHEIQQIPLVERVYSLATANIVRPIPATAADDGGIEVTPLLEDRSATQAGADAVKADALDDPLLRGDLVSADGRSTAIVVTFDERRIDEARSRTIAAVEAAVRSRAPSSFDAFFNGSLEISEAYNRVTISNTEQLTPFIAGLTLIALYGMFRSASRVLLLAVAIASSAVWTIGLYGLAGFQFNVLTSMLVPLVVVLAVADDVHIVQHFDQELRRSGSHEQAFVSSVSHLAGPLLGASITTALGLASLAASDIVAVRTFGIGAGIGVMVDCVMSLVLVPTLLTFVRPRRAPAPQERWLLEPLRRAGRFAFAHSRTVLLGMTLVAAVCLAGVTRLRVDTNHINFFPVSHPLSQSAAVIDTELSGIYTFDVLLEGPPDSVTTPDALARMDRLQGELARLSHVRKVVSVVDYVKRVNQQLNGGAAAAHAIPASREAIAQELFVFGLSDEGRAELARVVASDNSRAHISVKLASMSSDVVFEQIFQAEALAARAFEGSEVRPTVTGSGRIFATLDHYMVTSQISSFGTAFVTVFGVLFLVFRSVHYGVLGVVANTFPIAVVLGLMGWLDISLNVATIMVASVTLGIVDDDTVHFIARFRRELAGGADPRDAVETAAMHEGRAALTTTIINGMGFGVLMLSPYRPTAWFGGLLALTMVVAFLAEVFVVPAMIALLPKWFSASRKPSAAGARVAMGLLMLIAGAGVAEAGQRPTGSVSAMVDAMPSVSPPVAPDYAVVELRVRGLVEDTFDAGSHLRLTGSGFVEGLLADRGVDAAVRDAIVRPRELHAELRWARADLRLGYSRIVWGRLDEVQPTDVVNPIDLARFFFDGRAEARKAVALARARWLPTDRFTLEGIVVPDFRPASFDELDEATSPFNILAPGKPEGLPPREIAVVSGACGDKPSGLPFCAPEPVTTWRNLQGGARANVTTGQVDWAISGYRGLEPQASAGYQRFTMIGGDFETVRGPWGLRGEAALRDRDDGMRTASGGIGVDRKAGSYRLAGNVIVSDSTIDDTDVTLVAVADRSFARETRTLRVLGVITPTQESGFTRVIASFNLRDNLWLDASAGLFWGDGRDVLSLLASRDFASARLRVYF